MLEPDDIPGLNSAQNDVDGPVRMLASTETDAEVSKPDVAESAQAIQPPPQIRANDVSEEAEQKFAQVQYRSRVKEQEFKPERVDTHSMAEINAMPQTEQREALKDSIRKVLAANAKRPITTQHNSPGDVLLMALPYGADARVYQPNTQADPRDKNAAKGSYMYSIGTLCWNYVCGGKTLLRSGENRICARVGAGYQKRPASFLALLAMSNIMPNYEMKVGGNEFTIANLIASEKATLSKGMNLSMALVGLSFYGEASDQWKSETGETWNVERMVTEELNRSIDQGSCDVTDWLLGLTAAVKLYEEEGKTLRGPIALARRQLGTYHDFVLSIQNENYLWHPKFFLFKGASADAYETLYSSGHILRWLLLSLPEKKLEDPKVVKALASLASTLSRIPTNINAGTMSDRQLESVAVSLHALAIYNQRVFGDEPEVNESLEEKAGPGQPASSVAQR